MRVPRGGNRPMVDKFGRPVALNSFFYKVVRKEKELLGTILFPPALKLSYSEFQNLFY